MTADSLASSVVVVTGASSGIGHATALEFARSGACVVLAARGPEALDNVAAACRQAGGEVLVVPTDVADSDAVAALAKAAVGRFGRIDVWVNNVGVGVVGKFDDVPIEAHRRVIEANLIGHMNGAHVVLPHFRRRGRGVLVNMISVAGWAAAPYAAAYSASKFALRGFTQALRAEVSDLPGVHVCAVYPTFVDTPAMANAANYTGKRLRPPPPLVDPRDVAAEIVAIARSPRGRGTTMVGSVALPARVGAAIAPDLVGRVTRKVIEAALRRAAPALLTDGNLARPSRHAAIDGGYRSATRGMLAGALMLGLVAVAGRALASRSGLPRG